MQILAMIENTSWVNPAPDISIFIMLIFLTVLIECGVIYFYARRQGYENRDTLLTIIIMANALTGLVGFIIGYFYL